MPNFASNACGHGKAQEKLIRRSVGHAKTISDAGLGCGAGTDHPDGSRPHSLDASGELTAAIRIARPQHTVFFGALDDCSVLDEERLEARIDTA